MNMLIPTMAIVIVMMVLVTSIRMLIVEVLYDNDNDVDDVDGYDDHDDDDDTGDRGYNPARLHRNGHKHGWRTVPSGH